MSRTPRGSERPLARPLQPMELMVLSVLHDAPNHGYGLVREIGERTEGALAVRPGNLYRVLDRLVDAGLVAESEPPGAPSAESGAKGAERTRFFSITSDGRARIASEAETLGRALGASPSLRRALRRGLGSAS
ncbi:MAG TPA: PadR family transcriptional regulator [Thermoanaerobaculia bacterium]|nr:PadR family transcriptional regulator [Thermoanaerobaculia bacterium]